MNRAPDRVRVELSLTEIGYVRSLLKASISDLRKRDKEFLAGRFPIDPEMRRVLVAYTDSLETVVDKIEHWTHKAYPDLIGRIFQ